MISAIGENYAAATEISRDRGVSLTGGMGNRPSWVGPGPTLAIWDRPRLPQTGHLPRLGRQAARVRCIDWIARPPPHPMHDDDKAITTVHVTDARQEAMVMADRIVILTWRPPAQQKGDRQRQQGYSRPHRPSP